MGENVVVPGDGNYVSEETIINEVFYNEVLYLPLDKINVSDNANMEKVLESTKEYMSTLDKKEQKALKEKVEYLEGMIEHHEDLKDVTISNMSWKDNDNNGKKDHPPQGMQAAVFTKGDEVNVVYRGTPNGSWIDNAEIVIGGMFYALNYVDKNGKVYKHLSPMQVEALKYMDTVLEKNGDEWEDKILTVGGHSKGDSLAALAMMVHGDEFDLCFGINGPGVSPETLKDILRNIGEEKFYEYQKKMYKLNEANDYVNPFGVPLYNSENIRWYKGFYPSWAFDKAHYVSPIYDMKTGKLANFVEGQGFLGELIRDMYLEVEELSPNDREASCYAIMSILQFFINREPPVEKDPLFYAYLIEKMDAMTMDIVTIMLSVLDNRIKGIQRDNPLRNMDALVIYAKSLRILIAHKPRLVGYWLHLPHYYDHNTEIAAISYSKVDGLITKLDLYIEEVERRYIKPAKDAKSDLSTITGAGGSKSSLNTVIKNYKDIKTGLENYKDLLNQYKTWCEETEDRFIKNLQGTETA